MDFCRVNSKNGFCFFPHFLSAKQMKKGDERKFILLMFFYLSGMFGKSFCTSWKINVFLWFEKIMHKRTVRKMYVFPIPQLILENIKNKFNFAYLCSRGNFRAITCAVTNSRWFLRLGLWESDRRHRVGCSGSTHSHHD